MLKGISPALKHDFEKKKTFKLFKDILESKKNNDSCLFEFSLIVS